MVRMQMFWDSGMIVNINASLRDAEREVISCDDGGGGSCNICDSISRVLSKYIDSSRVVM